MKDGKYYLEQAVSLVSEDILECLEEDERTSYTTILKPTLFEGLDIDIKDIF